MFAMISIGRALAMIPDYSKAKSAAKRIIKLLERKSQIDPHNESGIVLVEKNSILIYIVYNHS